MPLKNDAGFLRFLPDPNADPKAERTGEERVVLSAPPLPFWGYMARLMTLQLWQAAAFSWVGEEQPFRYRLLQTVVPQRVDAPHHPGAEALVFHLDAAGQTVPGFRGP